jgi:hypothetical protein
MNKTIGLFLFFICHVPLGCVYAQTTFEERMHEIYKTSYSTEVSDELWDGYLNNMSLRTYNVTAGDTLWDLSLVFFGDGNYWSKIWSYNQTLTNPHLISVGQEISFFSGSLEQPPGVSLTGEPIDGDDFIEGFGDFRPITDGDEVEEDGAPVATGLYPGAPRIPPPRDQLKPVPEKLPGSFKDFDGFKIAEYNFKDVSLDLRPPVKVNPYYVAHSFLYSQNYDRYPRIGQVMESESGASYLGLNDQVYLESGEDLNIGEELTVMSYDYTFDRNGIYGSVIRYAARARVLKKMPDNVFLAEIFYSLSGVRRGSWITREVIPTLGDDRVGRPSDLRLNIIGGGIDNASRIFGEGDVIYVQGGSRQGLRAGDILGVYKNRAVRFRETKVDVNPEPIGHIKVFRAENSLSSAFVLDSREEILPGDLTGPPTYVLDQASQSERDDLKTIEGELDFDTSFNDAPSETNPVR